MTDVGLKKEQQTTLMSSITLNCYMMIVLNKLCIKKSVLEWLGVDCHYKYNEEYSNNCVRIRREDLVVTSFINVN